MSENLKEKKNAEPIAGMPTVKRLNDFGGEKGFEMAGNVLEIITDMVFKPEHKAYLSGENNTFKCLSYLLKHEYEQMRRLFALMSDADPATYRCSGAVALSNVLTLCNDPGIVALFISQSQSGDAQSSGDASGATEAP